MLLTISPEPQRRTEALPTAQRAYDLNPNDMLAVVAIAFAEIGAGLAELSAAHLQQALRLSPRDPLRQEFYLMLATVACFNRDYAKGVEYALLGIAETPLHPALRVYLALNQVGLGDIARAKEAFDVVRTLAPAWATGKGSGITLGTLEHQRRVATFRLIAAGLEDPSAADPLR
jgi:adenylate cyclase